MSRPNDRSDDESPNKILPPKPMRRGSLGERYIKCGKPGCACAEDPERRHGPYPSLTRTVKGKTRSRFLSLEAAEVVARQIEDGRQFRHRIEEYWEECERLADEEIGTEEPKRREAAEKGGSKRHSERRASRRSKRS